MATCYSRCCSACAVRCSPGDKRSSIRHAVLGNAGTIISFRAGAEDAAYLEREFVEQFEQINLQQLPNHRIYLKLMIDGVPSRPFSAVTLPPRDRENGSYF